jgi:hypothetical protein
MPPNKFSRQEFKVRIRFLESGVTLQDEVVAITASYALNSIPVATATIASGMNVEKQRESKIHDAMDQFILREKIEIWLYVDPERGTDETGIYGMSRKWCKVFEGYYCGSGYQRTHASANFTLQFFHWLDDLACSSAINGSWHPGVPHDLAQAADGDIAVGSGGGGLSNFTPVTDPTRSIFNIGNIQSDLWENVLKKVFDGLAERDIGEQKPGASDGDEEAKGNNAAARAALKKMPGEAPKPAKLPFLSGGLSDITLSLGAMTAISNMAKTGLSYSSFWSKLIGEFGPEFLFAVSPSATFANVIPHYGGIRKEWVRIKGDEYNYASFNHSISSLIESIEIRFAQNSTSGGWPVGGGFPSLSYYKPLSRFPQRNTKHRGQVIVKDPPAWITNTIPSAVYGPWSSGVQGTPSDQGEGKSAPPDEAQRPADTDKNLQGAPTVNAYAKQWYQTAVLSQRVGELSGKLRFDIAPGSIVRIDVPNKDIELDYNDMQKHKYALVTQVAFSINAQQPSAGTSFMLTNIRTKKENNDSQLTNPVPPLYPASDWKGGPLVKEAMP